MTGVQTCALPILVIFDLGRVLIRICDGWAHACEVAGVRAPRLDLPLEEKLVAASHAHERGEVSNDRFFETTAALVGLEPAEVERVATQWLRGPMPEIEPLIDDVLASGVQTACLSNTNALHWGMMNGRGPNGLPLHKLHHRFASHELGVMKPDTAIYEAVETATGVTPNRIVFFDDHPPNIAAAARRGWHAHRITPDRRSADQMREHLAQHRILVD